MTVRKFDTGLPDWQTNDQVRDNRLAIYFPICSQPRHHLRSRMPLYAAEIPFLRALKKIYHCSLRDSHRLLSNLKYVLPYLLHVAESFFWSRNCPYFMEPEGHYRIHKYLVHLSLSLASWIQSIASHSATWRSILVLSYHICLGLPSCLFPSVFANETLCTPLLKDTTALLIPIAQRYGETWCHTPMVPFLSHWPISSSKKNMGIPSVASMAK